MLNTITTPVGIGCWEGWEPHVPLPTQKQRYLAGEGAQNVLMSQGSLKVSPDPL